MQKLSRQGIPVKPGKEEMADLNRYLVQKDREIIENYIERKGSDDERITRQDLWYHID